MTLNINFDKFKQLYHSLICEEDISGFIDAEEAQYIITSKVNGWGYCTTKVNDYIYHNDNANTYFIIKKG